MLNYLLKAFVCILSFYFFTISCTSKLADDLIALPELSFEISEGKQTATYNEVVSFYSTLSHNYKNITSYTIGMTDSGEPLMVVCFSNDGEMNPDFNKAFNKKNHKNILLINNGIHPGEPDGIDATMLLLRDFAQGKIEVPKNTIIAVIPIYNIGGALNRNSTSRTNQNGPEEYGFRGNARNYDLNRDFIKADTKNAQTFAQIFSTLKPELFIDNHVSNGADYQYTLTHLFTQHNKLGGEMGSYLKNYFMPALEDSLSKKEWEITPYVNVFNTIPEGGFTQFMDSPRYSTGYASLHNTLGMMVETHMLKPYKQRVEGTYELMKSFIAIADANAAEIKQMHQKAKTQFKHGDPYPIQWKVDSSQTSTLNFKGFEGSIETSKVTGQERLKYHPDQPFTRPVSYYDNFKVSKEIIIPKYYTIPKGYWNVMDRLKENKIVYSEIKKDTIITAEVYRIESFETFNIPYEGHYPHYNTITSSKIETMTLKKGDYLVPTQQEGIRYLLETLEPSGVDSFFNWNYFDTILQQKEGFSPYVWEDKALQLLKKNPVLKFEFDSLKNSNPEFAKNWYAQLEWLHTHSPNYEEAHLRYPICRVGG